MERYAIFVDAGYFFAGGAQAAFGAQTPRKQLSLKTPAELVAALHEQATRACANTPLLRVYWYDAMPGARLSLEQTNIALLAGVKLRLGALNSAGEQKGVDSLIVTDLIDLARNRAIADAVKHARSVGSGVRAPERNCRAEECRRDRRRSSRRNQRNDRRYVARRPAPT